MMGPILNTILGAGIKIGANLVNAWLEQKGKISWRWPQETRRH